MTQEQINKTFDLLGFYWRMKNGIEPGLNEKTGYDCYRSSRRVATFFLPEPLIETWEKQEYKINPIQD